MQNTQTKKIGTIVDYRLSQPTGVRYDGDASDEYIGSSWLLPIPEPTGTRSKTLSGSDAIMAFGLNITFGEKLPSWDRYSEQQQGAMIALAESQGWEISHDGYILKAVL